jgi:hypothetical protein
MASSPTSSRRSNRHPRLFTRAARQTGPWAFESVVLVALLAWPLGLVEFSLGMTKAIAWAAGIVYLLAFAMCGWWASVIVSRWTIRRATGTTPSTLPETVSHSSTAL